eukprot:6233528-Prymnesium_polylepis.2
MDAGGGHVRRERDVRQSDRALRGDVARQTHLAEKLSEGRLQMIRDCIEECCGFDHSDGSATECRGGCG